MRKPKDVEYLYWTAAALGLAISVSKGDAKMLARLPEVEAQLDRALELNESWGDGSLHEFQIVFAAAKPGEPDKAKIRRHYERALEACPRPPSRGLSRLRRGRLRLRSRIGASSPTS